MSDSCTLTWDHGSARVMTLGAMLTDAVFKLPDGRQISPLHTAPWLGQTLPPETPPLLANLQGEWPCVPFGAPPHAPLTGVWEGLCPTPVRWPHGFGANHAWTLSQDGPDSVKARIDYPDDGPIASLTRDVRGRPGAPILDITLEIIARRAAQVPVGVHPVFRLPQAVGTARLVLGRHGKIWSYPSEGGGASAIQPRAPVSDFADLAQGTFDPLCLAYAKASETLLLVTQTDGQAILENTAEDYRAMLTWDADTFPSVMLWISNNGRQNSPWNGTHLALGVEPVCAPFDLGPSTAGKETPLARSGVRTAVSIEPKTTWFTRYAIGIDALC